MKIVARGIGGVLMAELTEQEFLHLLGVKWSGHAKDAMKEIGAVNQYGEPRFVGAEVDITGRFRRTLALEEQHAKLAAAVVTLQSLANLITSLRNDALGVLQAEQEAA